MFAAQVVYEIGSCLLLIMQCTALVLALTWPDLRGKGWLVSSLFVFLLVDLCTQLLEPSSNSSEPVLMGPDEYQQLWNDWFQLSCLALVGKVLFVIAVFQLGVGLKRFLSLVSTDLEAREI